MKLYFKRKTLAFNDQILCLSDAEGNLVYDWKTSVMLAKKIRLFDAEKNEVAEIKQVLKSLMPKYQIFVDGEMVLEIKKEFHPILPKYTLTGQGWEMENKLLIYEYGVTKGAEQILTAGRSEDHLEWQSRAFEVEIPDPRNQLLAAAVAVAINIGIEGETFIEQHKNH